MLHNENDSTTIGSGDSPCPESGRSARPAFMDLPKRDRPVGPPPCEWSRISLGSQMCGNRSAVSSNGGTLLCQGHAREIAESIGYVSLETARRSAERAVQHKLDTMQRELSRVHARLAETAPAKAARPKRNPDAPGTIYFLRSGAYFKIGWTSDLEQRMKAYPPDTQLLASQPGTKKDERAIHRRFAHLLGRGREWFVMAPEIEDHIARVVAEHGPAPVVEFTARRANRTAGRQKQYVGGPNRGSLASREVRG